MRLLGADKIGHYEHVAVEGLKGAVNKVWPGAFSGSKEEEKGEEPEAPAVEKKAKKAPTEEASMFFSAPAFPSSIRCEWY